MRGIPKRAASIGRDVVSAPFRLRFKRHPAKPAWNASGPFPDNPDSPPAARPSRTASSPLGALRTMRPRSLQQNLPSQPSRPQPDTRSLFPPPTPKASAAPSSSCLSTSTSCKQPLSWTSAGPHPSLLFSLLWRSHSQADRPEPIKPPTAAPPSRVCTGAWRLRENTLRGWPDQGKTRK